MAINMGKRDTFAQNESISPRQLYRLYVFNLLGVGFTGASKQSGETGKVWFYLNRTWCFHGMAIYVDSKRGTRTEEKYI